MFKPLDENSASAGSAALLKAAAERFGFAPRAHGVFAHSEAFYTAYQTLFQASIQDLSLSPEEVNVVFLSASVFHECPYCVAAHSALARRNEIDAQIIEALRNGRPLADQKLQILRETAEAILNERGRVSRRVLERFFDGGYSERAYLDALLVITSKVMSNYANLAAETALDDNLRVEAWRPA